MEKIERYKVEKVLGEGTFGVVRLAIDKFIDEAVAIKYIRVSGSEEGIPKAVFREMESLKQLSESKFIISLLDVYPDDTQLCLVFEYVPLDVADVIKLAKFNLTAATIKSFSYMILSALSHCHAKRIVHRDVKPSNIMITLSGQVKLADFGLARVIPRNHDQSLSHQVATRMYRPPELLFGSRNYSFSADIWSAGAVIGELMLLTPLFPGNNDIDQIFKVIQVLGSPTPQNWPNAGALPDFNKISFAEMAPMDVRYLFPSSRPEEIEFLFQLLRYDPCSRLQAQEAIVSDYFHQAPYLISLSEIAQTTNDLKGAAKKKRPPTLKNAEDVKLFLQSQLI